MSLYKADIELSDDPAHFGATVIVAAPDRKTALKMAKEAAIRAYNDQAGGWSLKPKVEYATCGLYRLPDEGLVMVAGRYER